MQKEYHDLAAQCDDFAEKLLDLCHDTEEVEVILNGDIASQVNSFKFWGNLERGNFLFLFICST